MFPELWFIVRCSLRFLRVAAAMAQMGLHRLLLCAPLVSQQADPCAAREPKVPCMGGTNGDDGPGVACTMDKRGALTREASQLA